MSEQNHTSRSGDPAYPNLLIAVKRVLNAHMDVKYAGVGLGGDRARLKTELDKALDKLGEAYQAIGDGIEPGVMR